MSQPSGQRVVLCRYCGNKYTRTNWMKRVRQQLRDRDGLLLDDTHLISCYRSSVMKPDLHAA